MADSKEKIIDAAIEVFAQKGKHGARMEEVAALAGVNKAMVYYYFSTKENLFKAAIVKIQTVQFNSVADKIEYIMKHIKSPVEKLTECIKAHFDTVSQNYSFAKILMEALISNPDYIHEAMESILKERHSKIHKSLEEILHEGVKQKIFRNVDPVQTQISIMGMNLAYFMGMPIGRALLDCPCPGGEEEFRQRRIESVIDLILNGLITRPEDYK
jgi:TetR/AcrR family transcriptional regulator